jgi:hypothetical protein
MLEKENVYTGVVMFDRPLDNSRENTSRNNAQTTYAKGE